MATDERVDDPFETYSGLPDDIDGTISGAYFGYDTDYMNGDKLALMFTLESEQLEAPEKMLFGTGKDWKPNKTPRGTSIDRQGIHRFHENSGCGLLLVAMKDAGATEAMKKTGKTPMDAALYDGLSFHWERKEFTYDLDEGKKVSNRLLPTKFLPASSNGSSAKAEKATSEKAPKKTKAEKLAEAEAAAADDPEDAPAPVAPAAGDPSALIESLTMKQRGKLSVKAMAAGSVEEFVDSVKDAGIVELDVLMAIASTLFTEANADD